MLVFVLQSGNAWDAELLTVLEKTWGPLRHKGDWHPFDQTNYYQAEMGANLHRAVASFDCLIDPSRIAAEKLRSIAVEGIWTGEAGGRKFNFDIGYMDPDKVVLPSCKQGPWKVYWGEGIWLDIVMHYAKGHFDGSPWSFEDFVRNPYQRDLLLIREKYKKSLKAKDSSSPGVQQ
jgi:hypothetical protein